MRLGFSMMSRICLWISPSPTGNFGDDANALRFRDLQATAL